MAGRKPHGEDKTRKNDAFQFIKIAVGRKKATWRSEIKNKRPLFSILITT
ncbi:hypothetical protein [Eubacterium sp.]